MLTQTHSGPSSPDPPWSSQKYARQMQSSREAKAGKGSNL